MNPMPQVFPFLPIICTIWNENQNITSLMRQQDPKCS